MATTLIISPTIFEAEPFFAELGESRKPKVGDCANSGDVVCLVSGIGCERSAARVKETLKRFKPNRVILAGFCGACGASIKNGDLVYESDSSEISKIGAELRGLRGKIACVEKIADTEKKIELGKNGFDGVEMEMDFFKPAIISFGAELSHFRWISDSLESDIPPEFFESTMNRETGELNLSIINLILSIIKSPKLIVKLAKFGAEIAPAKKAYANCARKLVSILKSE